VAYEDGAVIDVVEYGCSYAWDVDIISAGWLVYAVLVEFIDGAEVYGNLFGSYAVCCIVGYEDPADDHGLLNWGPAPEELLVYWAMLAGLS